MEGRSERRLQRSGRDRMLAGVCGGLGEYFDVDPIIWRLAFVLLTFFGGSGLLIYIAMAIIVPREGSEARQPREAVRDSIADLEHSVHDLGEEIGNWARPGRSVEEEERRERRRRTGGLILIALGVLFLAANLNLFFWVRWDLFWPLVLIVLGVALLLGWRRR